MKKIILSLMGFSLLIGTNAHAVTARPPVSNTTTAQRAPVTTVVTTSQPVATGAVSRAAVKRTSVMNAGTTIPVRNAATGLYSQECHDAYFGCLDQFCMSDNASGGRCLCSDDNTGYETQIASIKAQESQAETLRTLEVEKIQAGAQADIIFSGERTYDADGNVVTQQKRDTAASDRRPRVDLSLWATPLDFGLDNVFENTAESLADKTGASLYAGARNLCLQRLPDNCSTDVNVLTQLYQTQIRSDCAAFATAVATQQRESDLNLATAQAEVRAARLASFEAANKYNRGECLINFKQCMMGTDVCGADWSRCASTIASVNMQNNKAVSTANTSVPTIEKFNLSVSTREMLSSKRNMCEGILDQCVAVRDSVWPDFLRDIAPELKVAELNLESNMRQSCMTDISNCITGRACADTIAGGDTIDACLTRDGQIARAVCKNVIDPCERMEPLIWDYVVARLRAMGADRCTEEVKTCFARTCGENFQNCIGMDYNFMHSMCPLETLVVCKNNYAARGQEFSMADLDGLLMGLYLNVDNAALDNCQNLVETKMVEICGSTSDCNRFTADENVGANSINAQKIDDLYRVTGMISFGSIKVGDGSTVRDGERVLGAGEIGVADYIANVRSSNTAGVPNREAIIGNIEAELNNIAGTINRTINLISEDPKIQFCITGRDLSQITGGERGENNTTAARFPNLMYQVKMVVAESALRAANDNYNKKLNEEIARATKDASADLAQFMCQKMAETGGINTGTITPSSSLTPPYAISYDIALGLTKEDLMNQSVYSQSQSGGMTMENGKFKTSGGGVTRETWAIFDREGRNCRFCTSSVTESCKTTGSRGLWGLWDSRKTSCETSEPIEQCQDIPM